MAGAGGFIGGWLVRYLQESGFTNLRAVDIKPLDEWYQVLPGVDNRVADLRSLEACGEAVRGVSAHLQPRGDMGGMGFIEANKAAVHALRADQHAPADGRQGRRASSGISSLPRRASTTSTSSRMPT